MAARAHLLSFVSLAALLAAGCATIPDITYEGAEAPDAQAPVDASIPGVGPDAATVTDSGVLLADAAIEDADTLDADAGDPIIDDPADAAAIDAGAGTTCNDHLVANCGQCQGKPLRCVNNGRDTCVSDCTACNAGWYPCIHCAGDGTKPRGRCVPPNAKGKLSCSNGSRCPCSGTAAACPKVTNAAQSCLGDTDAGGQCFTCGEATTANEPCMRADGTTGVCAIEQNAPVCH